MKFLAILSLSSSALATISSIQLFAKSDDSKVDGLGLYSKHEGAAIDYLFLGKNGADLKYDDEKKQIFQELKTSSITVRQLFTLGGDVYEVGATDNFIPVTINKDGTLSFTGDDKVYASKNVNDPYRYSESEYAVSNKKTDDSAPITIVAKFSDDKAAETSGVAQAASSSAGPAQASVSNFEGAAGQNKLSYGVGMAAVVAGLVM